MIECVLHAVIMSVCLPGRYLTEKGEVSSVFLTITDLFDGKAETIEKALLNFCDKKNIPITKIMGFGSDGASVMIGRVSGISTRLKKHNPLMINVHCIAHRLACAGCCSIIK